MSEEFYNENVCKVIEKIIDKSNEGKVICVDGEWGTGKTYFCDRFVYRNNCLRSAESGSKFNVIYFNAFQSDFDADPIIAIVAAVANSLDPADKEGFLKKVAENNFLDWPLLTSVGGSLLGNVSDMPEEVCSSILGYLKIAADQLNRKNNEKNRGKPSVLSLQSLVKEYMGSQKTVFLIDELDRCRPTYAVEVIEKIKHIFGSLDSSGNDSFYFILTMDKSQLIRSINHFYGLGEKSSVYLEKFIDLTVELKPQNSIELQPVSPFAFYFYNIAKSKIKNLSLNENNITGESYEKFFYFLMYVVDRRCSSQMDVSFRKMDRLCDFILTGFILNDEEFLEYYDVLVFGCCLYVLFFQPESLQEEISDSFYRAIFSPGGDDTSLGLYLPNEIPTLKEGEDIVIDELIYISLKGFKDIDEMANKATYAKQIYDTLSKLGNPNGSRDRQDLYRLYRDLLKRYEYWFYKARQLA